MSREAADRSSRRTVGEARDERRSRESALVETSVDQSGEYLRRLHIEMVKKNRLLDDQVTTMMGCLGLGFKRLDLFLSSGKMTR